MGTRVVDNSKKAAIQSGIRFLMTVYKDSINDVAAIICAEAEGDTGTLKKYLTSVRDFANKLIEEL